MVSSAVLFASLSLAEACCISRYCPLSKPPWLVDTELGIFSVPDKTGCFQFCQLASIHMLYRIEWWWLLSISTVTYCQIFSYHLTSSLLRKNDDKDPHGLICWDVFPSNVGGHLDFSNKNIYIIHVSVLDCLRGTFAYRYNKVVVVIRETVACHISHGSFFLRDRYSFIKWAKMI